MNQRVFSLLLVVAVCFWLQPLPRARTRAAEPAQPSPKPAAQAWTLQEALSQLTLSPHDPYLQYVALQLARRQNARDVGNQIRQMFQRNPWQEAQEQADLLSLFTGALAVQESLQLDTMSADETAARSRPANRAVKGPRGGPEQPRGPVKIASLTGPTIKSHPWERLLAGRKPAISSLARCVPEDFYWIEFRSLAKLLDAMEISDLWGTHLFDQATRDARTQAVSARLKQQLAVETDPLLRPFYDLSVHEVAATGSDLYLREGSDVTLLFRFTQPALFKSRMDGFLDNAQRRNPDAKKTTGTFLGIDFVHVETPDRSVNVYAAYPAPDLHVRSNSRPAFERVLEAIRGEAADGQAVHRLGDSAEFAYIRTLFPRGAPEEDGFVYLSDPFIRRLVGPQLKLTEQRRMVCYNHLRMIGHAALLYQSEHGKPPSSLEELAKADCCPGKFNEGALRCPDGGTYSLAADGMTGVCSHHGTACQLRPCCEIPVSQVSGDEADAYAAFLKEYNQYWRTFFDPIALRLHVTPRRYRLETLILPLIDNSIYTMLARTIGGRPEPLDALPVPKRNILSVAVRLNREQLLRESGLLTNASVSATARLQLKATDRECANHLYQIGAALNAYTGKYGCLPAGNRDKQGKPLLSWRVDLLPILGEEELYKEFRLDEAWNSPHNAKLVARMPDTFACAAQEHLEPGRTTYLAAVGRGTLFTDGAVGQYMKRLQSQRLQNITVVDADTSRAVVWTKPEDLSYDPSNPQAGLSREHHGLMPVLLENHQVHFLRESIDKATLQALFTGQPAAPINLEQKEAVDTPAVIPGLDLEELGRIGLSEFLTRGIGDQIGFHVYDARPFVDFNFPQFIGMMLGGAGGWGGPALGSEELLISFLVASVNAPVYLSIPVNDPTTVDRFLDELDRLVAARARQKIDQFVALDLDFYRLQGQTAKIKTRAFGVRFGPVKFRIYWARIGGGLYIASKPFILEDLARETAAGADSGPPAHAMMRMRPAHWNEVLPEFRLGWAENNRDACLANVGALTAVTRSLSAWNDRGDPAERLRQLRARAELVHGVHFFCPEGGEYVLAPDGMSVMCTRHGTILAPHQSTSPAEASSLGKLLQTFSGMTATLTLREDGLQAVLLIERK